MVYSYSKVTKERIKGKCCYGQYADEQKDTDTTIMALELGAIDFVTKPNNIIEAKGQEFKIAYYQC